MALNLRLHLNIDTEALAEALANLSILSADSSFTRDDNKDEEELGDTTPTRSLAFLHSLSRQIPVHPNIQPNTDPQQPSRKRGPRKSAPNLPTRTGLSDDVPRQPRAISEPPPDTIKPKNQCTAIAARTGLRCRRLLGAKSSGTFCFSHAGKMLDQNGFFSHQKSDTFVEFAIWIPRFLSTETQLKLRAAMAKPPWIDDAPGYVYAFEIIDPATPDLVHIKVGFSTNMTKRLDEWERQCPSKRIVLRGSWPPCTSGGDEDGSQYVNGAVSMLRGTIKPGKAVEYPRRIEELIHIELEDVASNSLHLNPEFMNPEGAGSQMAASRRKPSKVERKPCIDCKKTHREIFTFKRVTSGELKGKEWESVVQPIIEKWGAFVAEYV